MAEKMRSQEARLTRGVVAARTGCHIETVRYYERICLLPPPPRTEGGHRLYDEDLLRRLNFICRSRELGFTIEEVRDLLGLVDGGGYTCAEVKEITLDQVLRHRPDARSLAFLGPLGPREHLRKLAADITAAVKSSVLTCRSNNRIVVLAN